MLLYFFHKAGSMGTLSVEGSVAHLNLEYYRKRLATETDSTIRQILIRLIAEEEARLAPPNEQRTSAGQEP